MSCNSKCASVDGTSKAVISAGCNSSIGVVCMAMIANLQYGWTYFVDPMRRRIHWGVAGIQLAFSMFVATGNLADPDRSMVRRLTRSDAVRSSWSLPAA